MMLFANVCFGLNYSHFHGGTLHLQKTEGCSKCLVQHFPTINVLVECKAGIKIAWQIRRDLFISALFEHIFYNVNIVIEM